MINNFSLEEYNSDAGFPGEIWGSCLWLFLHIISFNYPCKPSIKHKMYYYSFLKILPKILPCGICRKHLKELYKKMPLITSVFKNRKSLSKYIFQLHEEINIKLNKKNNLTYTDVANIYENFRSRCLNNSDCPTPLYKGIKSKCIINIIPRKEFYNSLNIDSRCLLQKI
jgi:hypothetical protein